MNYREAAMLFLGGEGESGGGGGELTRLLGISPAIASDIEIVEAWRRMAPRLSHTELERLLWAVGHLRRRNERQ